MKRVFRSLKRIKHFVRKKPIQMLACRAMVFFCMGRLFHFLHFWRGPFLTLKKV